MSLYLQNYQIVIHVYGKTIKQVQNACTGLSILAFVDGVPIENISDKDTPRDSDYAMYVLSSSLEKARLIQPVIEKRL